MQEKLTAEVLARARAEEELQHLRVCIEERDGTVHFIMATEDIRILISELV